MTHIGKVYITHCPWHNNNVIDNAMQCCSYGTQSAVGTNNGNDNGVFGLFSGLQLDNAKAMTMTLRQELLEELDAFDPRWKQNYSTLQTACMAAGCFKLYLQFVNSHEGNILERLKQTEVDWNEVNERSRAQVAAEIDMANKGSNR